MEGFCGNCAAPSRRANAWPGRDRPVCHPRSSQVCRAWLYVPPAWRGPTEECRMIHHHHSTPVNPLRVVILGASGFVGSDLLAYLREQRLLVVGYSSHHLDLLKPQS